MQIFKLVLAVFVGVFVGSLVVWATQMIENYMYPAPPNFNVEDKEALAQLIANAPIGAKLMIIFGYIAGSFVGGLLTQLIAQSRNLIPSICAGVVLLIAGIITLINIPHPTWMVVVNLLVFIPFAYLGGFWQRKKPHQTQPF